MAGSWKFDVQSVREGVIVDGKIDIKLDVDAHGPTSATGQLHLMLDKEAAENLRGRLTGLLKQPRLS
jgi:hypothetical protein